MATATLDLPTARRRAQIQAAGRSGFPEVYFIKRIDNSRLRREVDLEKRRQCFRLLGLCSLIFIFGLLFAWQHFQCVRFGYQIEQLKAQRSALEEWNHQLRLEQASLADPQRIDTLARKELGLVPPAPQQVIRLAPALEQTLGDTELARNLSEVRGSKGEIPRRQ